LGRFFSRKFLLFVKFLLMIGDDHLKKLGLFFLFLFVATSFVYADGITFYDINEQDWYYSAVEKISKKGLMKGYEDGSFKPNQFVTRAELAQVLSSLKNDEEQTLSAVATILPSTVLIQTEKDEGTGFFVSENQIITNWHVIQNATDNKVKLFMFNDEEFEGTISKINIWEDLALINVSSDSSFKVVRFAPSIVMGETAIAVGNALGFGYTVTKGVVSGLDRTPYLNLLEQKLIQFDTAVNGGNSGGPLINSKGEVLGLIKSKIIGSEVENVGFAIPIETIKFFLKREN
jgi:S1-C subfamily serine protease